jgi:hypothetical protein
MFGVLLMSLASGFNETADSLGKYAVSQRRQNIYTMGFLSLFWTQIFLLATLAFGASFRFSLHSLPTFIPRLILEVILADLTLRAIVKADRSTFSLVRLTTVPLLLLFDLRLHYAVTAHQIAGILLIFLTLLVFLSTTKHTAKGWFISLVTAVVASITLTLYKYDISHYNSVVAEQFIILFVIMIYMLARNHIKPWGYLFKSYSGSQSFLSGIGSVLESFAYFYAPASVILTTKRAMAVFWSIIFGNRLFKEKQLVLKLAVLAVVTFALVLLTH